MKRYFKIIFMIITISFCFNCKNEKVKPIEKFSNTNVKFPDILSLLPSNKVAVEIMGIANNTRQQEIMLKFKAAIKKNEEWMMNYVKKQNSTGKLPYHKNFGVTEDEYEQLFTYLTKTAKFQKIANEKLTIKKLNDERFSFSGTGQAQVLNKVILDLKKGILITPIGEVSELKKMNISEKESAFFGPYKGYSWIKTSKFNELTDDIIQINLTIGKMKKNEKIFLDYKARRFRDKQQIYKDTVLLFYKNE
jgi:hypothetical protein